MLTPDYLEITSSRVNWRVDSRDYLLLGLYHLACGARAVQRRLVITDCAGLDGLSVARLVKAGAGYVTCRQ
jgi:hypothetical protein